MKTHTTHTIQEGSNTYLVRLVPVGAAYGRNDCLTNDGSPMVEFHLVASAEHPAPCLTDIHGPLGSFIGRYNLNTLTNDWITGEPRPCHEGLMLRSPQTGGSDGGLSIRGENLTHTLIALLSAALG